MSQSNSPVANLRLVMVQIYDEQPGPTHGELINHYQAHFHAWGVNHEVYETGPGNYSTAIVERSDGTIRMVSADLIRFLDRN